MRCEVTHVPSILKDSIDVLFICEDACEWSTQNLDDGQTMETKAIFTILAKHLLLSSVLVSHLFLEQKSIFQKYEDRQRQKEKIVYPLTEKIDPNDLCEHFDWQSVCEKCHKPLDQIETVIYILHSIG